MSRFVIFGSGGFGRELVGPAKLVRRLAGGSYDIVFAVDDPGDAVFDDDVREIAAGDIAAEDRVVIAVGDPAARRGVAERLTGTHASLHAASALVGPDVVLGDGSILSDQVIVTASARIGRFFHANIYAYVAHDCVVGDYVTLAPRAAVNGNVHIGDGAYIGTGAIIKQGTAAEPIVIGEGAIVGMGAVVTRSVAPGAVVVGNPAKPR